MDERARIVDLMRRAAEGDAWHGPSLREVLAGIDAGRAATRSVPGAHTVWELVQHVGVWREVVRRRLAGEWPEPTPAEDFPSAHDPSEERWAAAIAEMEAAGLELRAAVEALPPERVAEPIRPGDLPVYVVLHGVVQHDLYHAGQIALLKRALGMGAQV